MPNTVKAVPLPPHSALHPRKAAEDFLDTYAVPSDLPVRKAAEVIVAFPEWVAALMRLRTVLVTPFGLKTEASDTGSMMGPFPIEAETEDEIIAGFNDTHLDFRVSILRHDGKIHLSTWVHRHNLLGRIYLATIMPFHILVARNALSRVAAT